jgi:hypothetical protein
MRHRTIWAGALTLGLCAASLALGEEPGNGDGNWLSRLFSRGSSAPTIRAADKKEDKAGTPTMAPAVPRAQALADCLRRLEVCDRLREIAFQTGDMDLMRKVEQIEQRVADTYTNQTKQAVTSRSLDEDLSHSRLAPKAGSPSAGGGRKGNSGGGSLEGRP